MRNDYAKQLSAKIETLRKITGKDYQLDRAYGGVKLVEIVTETGGEYAVLNTGYVTNRTLLECVSIYIEGIYLGKGLK